eukprot:6176313-Pleurochrysis_carterae.AAC.4
MSAVPSHPFSFRFTARSSLRNNSASLAFSSNLDAICANDFAALFLPAFDALHGIGSATTGVAIAASASAGALESKPTRKGGSGASLIPTRRHSGMSSTTSHTLTATSWHGVISSKFTPWLQLALSTAQTSMPLPTAAGVEANWTRSRAHLPSALILGTRRAQRAFAGHGVEPACGELLACGRRS